MTDPRSAESLVGRAVEVAESGLSAGEMPIGAVIWAGDEEVASAHTRERELGRRIVHADLLAMVAADEVIGFAEHPPLTLAVNLEPCLMCLGAAVTLGVDRVVFGLWSPDDGGVEAFRSWRPRRELAFFRPPRDITGGHVEDRVRDQFRRNAEGDGPPGMRAWAARLATPA